MSTRLRRLAQPRPPQPTRDGEERCELCGEEVWPGHRHLLDVESRRLLCACRPCSILFDSRAAGGTHYRLVPDTVRRVEDLDLDDIVWNSLRIPVELAFFFHSSAARAEPRKSDAPPGRVVAFYPSPAGATESLLELGAWDDLVARNPLLASLEPDVEALLVNRTGAPRWKQDDGPSLRPRLHLISGASPPSPESGPEHFLVPVDRCYALVGLIRLHWQGFGGGPEVWREVDGFFEELRRGAKTVTKEAHP